MVPVSDQDMNTHLAEVSRVRNIFCAVYIVVELKFSSLKVSHLVNGKWGLTPSENQLVCLQYSHTNLCCFNKVC